MAKRRPTSSKTPRGTADDAFTARILEFTAWARQRTELVIASVVVLVLVVGGAIYFVNQRAEQRVRAEAELQTIQQTVMFQEPEESIAELREYLGRFGGTPHAVEARLVLAEILLGEGDAHAAVEVLEEVAPSFRNPLRVQATILLAVALEEAEQWDRAADVYAALSRDAEFSFQRRDATEGLARVHLERGDSVAAADAYRRVLQDLEQDAPERSYFEMRLAELTAGDPS